jgi:UTP--glucose-1-phosphate uridylyltransferase
LQYVVEEAADAALDDVLIITSPDKRAIEEHFSRNPQREDRLKTGGKEAPLAGLNALLGRLKIHFVHQSEQRGLGDAVNQARRHVGNEAFVCLLGDTIFSGQTGPARQLLEAYEQLGTSVIGLEEVAAEKVNRYGIVAGTEIRPGVYRLTGLVEKPPLDAAPSRLAIAARYVLTPGIFDCLDKTPRGKNSEIQLTDALRLLLEREPIHGVILRGRRHDIGNPIDWLKTNLFMASDDAAIWKELEPMMRSLLEKNSSR